MTHSPALKTFPEAYLYIHKSGLYMPESVCQK